jgi:50S ribosomal protein L16 3-hydroxylase
MPATSRDMHKNFLGVTPRVFLKRYWQKDLLLARGALVHCVNWIDRDVLFGLAARDDTESRLVMRARNRWTVRHGPFAKRILAKLPARNWTILVQGVNHLLPQATQLLQQFAFLPYARLDDLMVSYAAPGGGVGPHFDSYDVFLVQGRGRRRWRVSTQRDLRLVAHAPLKLLQHFRPSAEFVLDPGDLLYLPPRYAHDGIAVGECVTCSIGFRAPSAQELARRFLEFLQDRLTLPGLYEDPDLVPTRHPARIGADMIARIGHLLERIDWRGDDVVQFIGTYLTEPKPHIIFEHPPHALGVEAFARAAQHRGIELALTTLMLFHGHSIFINGEAVAVSPGGAALLSQLADARHLRLPATADRATIALLYEWYRAGYIRCQS